MTFPTISEHISSLQTAAHNLHRAEVELLHARINLKESHASLETGKREHILQGLNGKNTAERDAELAKKLDEEGLSTDMEEVALLGAQTKHERARIDWILARTLTPLVLGAHNLEQEAAATPREGATP